MRVLAFGQLARTYRPATGVGRYINNMLLGLAARDGFDVELLFSKSYLGPDGKPDPRTPLGALPFRTYPWHERAIERAWKLSGWPRADRWLGGADWLFLPAEARVPSRVPTVLTIHDIRFWEPSVGYHTVSQQRADRRRWAWWLPPALEAAKVVTTVSQYTKSRLVELLGVDAGKIVVVGNGAEQSFFDVAEQNPATLPRAVPGPYLLVVGGLKCSRGAGWVLEMARLMAERKGGLTIVSAGKDDPDMAAEARKHPNVKLLGTVGDDVMPGYVRNATAVLFLSMYEGFGIPAVEAMAAGTPVVTSDLTALPEVAGDGAVVTDPADVEGVLATCERLSSDPAYRAEWSARGRRRAAAFTWDKCVDRLAAVLRGEPQPPWPGAAFGRPAAALPPVPEGVTDRATLIRRR